MSAALAIKAVLGVLADQGFGEPRRWHPLVGFGRLAAKIETAMTGHLRTRGGGLIAWGLAVLPWFMLAVFLRDLNEMLRWVVDIALLYFALGARSLVEHGTAVALPLAAGDLDEARKKVGWMVSRQTDTLDAAGVAKAGCESVLENGNDAIFGALFWFCLLGGPGALLFRLANTLDAMWGYRTPKFVDFGWAAARIDDILNWLPARLTALTYALLGNWRDAISCWRNQGSRWESPNAGPVMAAGAGALGVKLGGSAIYHGQEEMRPALGCGAEPNADSLFKAIQLVRRGVFLWLSCIIALSLAAGI